MGAPRVVWWRKRRLLFFGGCFSAAAVGGGSRSHIFTSFLTKTKKTRVYTINAIVRARIVEFCWMLCKLLLVMLILIHEKTLQEKN